MKKIWVLILTVITVFTFVACTYDGPPKEDTPDPPALSGTFVCGDSSLTFNGDGSSIILKIDEKMAVRTDLPTGEQKGTYVFLLYNGKYRYDKAEYFRVIFDDGKTQYQFLNALGTTNGDTIAFYRDAEDMIVFKKK